MTEGKFSVVLFFSSNYSIWTSKVLKKEGLKTKMIPVPRSLSTDCGYCVRIKTADIPKVKELLEKNNIEYEKIVEV